MLETILQSFSFIPQTATEELIFEKKNQKFTLYVAMATNQIQRFGQNSYES